MIKNASDCFTIETYLDAPIEKVWRSIATPDGMNSYLTYKSSSTGDPHHPKQGDHFYLNYGDIENDQLVALFNENDTFRVFDTYKSISPDGSIQKFQVQTTTKITIEENNFTKLALTVKGFGLDTFGQWFRECMRLGWTRSLINLKSVLELGMDLRTALFSYPRLGVLNCTVNSEQKSELNYSGEGNYLLEVFPNSPASIAGLKQGDIILFINDKETPNYDQFVKIISTFDIEKDNITIRYYRDGAIYDTKIQLSLEESFTGLVDTDKETFDDIKQKREALAKQRSSSGSLWKEKGVNES
ncbi:PDZ domain-containing protein [Bacillus sp. SM2101]|uniref:PDZ domain-containing protein n=1 Tax=Bacillus sp. SM2101 TaxID=2805366 RepID=UPI001BDEA7E5|nr:PDZ domain-containing protein [Bacillus sp. SM2101]